MNLKIQTSLIKNRFKTAGKIIISNSNLEKVPLKNSSIIHKIDQIGGTNLIKEVNEIIIYGISGLVFTGMHLISNTIIFMIVLPKFIDRIKT